MFYQPCFRYLNSMPGTSDLQSEEEMLDGLQLRGRSFNVSTDHSRSPSTEDGSFYHPDNNNLSADDDENIKSVFRFVFY